VGFDELIRSKKVIICCGSGGVGKTTLSAALAVRAAELGLKTLVLTIDPARRLANALGLKDLDDSECIVPGQSFPGELHAAMLDTKKTFDGFIIRLAPSPEMADRVLRNPMYQQLSTALGGSQEFTSLEKLHEAYISAMYDVVILDTPPTQHAMDFLSAPVKIHALFQENIIKWFLMPITALDKLSFGFMNKGTRIAMRLVEKVVGGQVLGNLTEFFLAIRDWQGALRERTAEVHRLLTSKEVGFVLVTGFSQEKIDEAKYFQSTLHDGGFDLRAIVVNRAFPTWLKGGEEVPSADDGSPLGRLKKYYQALQEFFSANNEAFNRLAHEIDGKMIFAKVPDFDQDVHDLKALQSIARLLVTSVNKGSGI